MQRDVAPRRRLGRRSTYAGRAWPGQLRVRRGATDRWPARGDTMFRRHERLMAVVEIAVDGPTKGLMRVAG